jgi:phosphatidate cytidylyltransferase
LSRALVSSRSSLSTRIISAVIFLPVLILLLLQGGWPYLVLVEAIVTLGVLEFYRMAQAKGAMPHTLVGVISAAGLVALLYYGHTAASGLLVTGAFLLVLILELRRGRPEGSMLNIGTTVLGVFYVGWLGGHLGLLRTLAASAGHPELGAGVIIFTFFVTWSGDTGAYFVGRAWGRHPLYPAVSPRKSVEGAFGGLAAAIVAGFLGRTWLLPELNVIDTLILGLVAGSIGPIGDLVESLMKRDSGLKDSAAMIPGHGGVLDRFDSLLFVSPVFYYYLKYMVFRG